MTIVIKSSSVLQVSPSYCELCEPNKILTTKASGQDKCRARGFHDVAFLEGPHNLAAAAPSGQVRTVYKNLLSCQDQA